MHVCVGVFVCEAESTWEGNQKHVYAHTCVHAGDHIFSRVRLRVRAFKCFHTPDSTFSPVFLFASINVARGLRLAQAYARTLFLFVYGVYPFES